jgi:hypothetical protein
MGKAVVSGAVLQCSMGASPGSLTVVPPGGRVSANQMVIATIMDFAPTTNIAPFGMCQTLSNPQVAAATSAAQGVLTPQPCIPATTAPWTPGSSKVTIGQMPALTDSSTCMCMWGGTITIKQAGSATVDVG